MIGLRALSDGDIQDPLQTSKFVKVSPSFYRLDGRGNSSIQFQLHLISFNCPEHRSGRHQHRDYTILS